ncbi:VOC family protein [Actinocorallia sp. A-T 12471]|uniref:VOC family protein n=1 Tax=Actinocorallia sp. A-T 12471 TaxID=3089813 RepID=UPI0029CF38FC|nr:VOC family protein [Actinocorallia sp. A-T 12471]MDX6741164.1 VOC family protein [Actinocorallia sp. A-T 12471]
MSGPRLVQATVAAADLAPAAEAARALLGLPPGFPDPELASWGIVNEILGLGGGTYLEIVAPSTSESALHGFLKRGEGGYVVGMKVPDTDAVVARAGELGVTVAHRQEFHGADIVQFHPAGLGVLLEADRLPDGVDWHYDTWDTPERPADAPTGRLLAVDVAVAEPEVTAALWADLLGAERSGPAQVTAGDGVIRFVPERGRRGLVAADIAASAPAEHTLAGLLLRFIPEEAA